MSGNNYSVDEGDDLYSRPVTSNNQPVPNRLFYPLHQQDFDEIERNGGPVEPRYGLNKLKDCGNEPPPHRLAVIVKCAILGSPRRMLTLREIRIAMCRRFEYYSKSENTGWCNTVRHILSTDPDFQKLNRPRTDYPGAWWSVSQTSSIDLEPQTSGRLRRPPAQTSGNGSPSRTRTRGGFPAQLRRRRVEPWMEMTSTFATSEAQDREDLRIHYAHMQGGYGSTSSDHQYYPGLHAAGSDPYAAVAASSSAHSAYYRSLEITNSNDSSATREPLPDIRSLGILDLGTRSGVGRSHQYHSQPSTHHYSQSTTHYNTYDEEEDEDYYDEDEDDF